MIWRLMDTYDLIKDIKEPFTSRVLHDEMLARGMDPKLFCKRYYVHLTKLAKQGYLKRVGEQENPLGRNFCIYEVVRK